MSGNTREQYRAVTHPARSDGDFMPKRLRKLIGTCAIVIFVVIYGPVAMALAESRIMEAPQFVQVLAYIALGIAWIFPLMPVIRWMERPRP
jgi:hypothetical protein